MARKIRQQRLKRKLTQRAVAREVGCAQSYIAHIECGRRPCSKPIAARLEVLLRVKKGAFCRFDFPRGRPPLVEAARPTWSEIREAVADRSEADLSPLERAPRFPRADRVPARENPFWPMAVHLGASAAEEVVRLERRRAGDDRFWRLANSLRFDSWSEKRLTVQLGLRCQQLVAASLSQLGCELRGADGLTGRDTHSQAHPVFLMRHQGASIAWMPQRCVRSASGYRWPDAIVVVAREGRKITLVVELDGPSFHRELARGEARDRDLGVSVLHVHPDVLTQADGLDRILDWACAKLAAG